MNTETMRWLGLRFSKLLSYSYAGFLLFFLGGILNPSALSRLREAASWELMALTAIVVGAGVHAFHRTLFVPIHHLVSSLLWRLLEIGKPEADTHIPTRWLGTLDPPVRFFWQIPAYSALRHSEIFKDCEDRWDLIHAELGLVLLTGEGLVAAALVMKFVPALVEPIVDISPTFLLVLALVFILTPVVAAYPQHRSECLAFRARRAKVISALQDMGYVAIDAARGSRR